MEQTITHLHPVLKKKVRAALEEIQLDPYGGKPLRDELKGFFSFRVSSYRIVYRIRHRYVEIQVVDVGPRNVIYERAIELLRIKGKS